MKDQRKTKSLLISELTELRRRIVLLEKTESQDNRAEARNDRTPKFAECILETMREPILVLSSDLTILFANRSFYTVFRVTPTETIGSYLYDLGNRQWNIPRLRLLLENIIPKNHKFEGFKVEHRFAVIGQKVMMLNARRVYHQAIDNQMILLAIEDITERVRLEKKLISISITDELTGLFNRRGLFTLGNKLLKIAKRQKKGLYMLYVDLDQLKTINDTAGHSEGDKALVAVAGVLREHYRESDIIARIGGDEFVVFPVGIAGDCTAKIITRLQKAIEIYNLKSNQGYKLTLSVGIAYYDPESDSSISELIVQGDKLMYKQKRKKKTHHVESRPSNHTRSQRRIPSGRCAHVDCRKD